MVDVRRVEVSNSRSDKLHFNRIVINQAVVNQLLDLFLKISSQRIDNLLNSLYQLALLDMIKVMKQTEDLFEVTVNANPVTKHHVIITDKVHRDLTEALKSKEELLIFSFDFLLKREPNSSILLSFELDVISTYFPDFDNVVSDWLSGNYIQVEKYT